eukprot:3743191-Pyramimonas_sp.AAC.1
MPFTARTSHNMLPNEDPNQSVIAQWMCELCGAIGEQWERNAPLFAWKHVGTHHINGNSHQSRPALHARRTDVGHKVD